MKRWLRYHSFNYNKNRQRKVSSADFLFVISLRGITEKRRYPYFRFSRIGGAFKKIYFIIKSHRAAIQ